MNALSEGTYCESHNVENFDCFKSFINSTLSDQNDPQILSVKNGNLDACTNKSLGRMVDGFMNDSIWSSGISENNQTFINVSGGINYAEKNVNAILQFIVKGDSFQFNALEFNGVPQNNFLAAALLSKMCN
tara:strand:+ start:532 stop:924 length:393 start_codon:yes stop_codon:yes gene_type:complete